MADQGRLGCDLCQKRFKDKYNLTRQKAGVHEAPLEGYPCTMCDKIFTREDNLKLHVERHTNDQRFPCPVCPKIYASKSKQKVHMAKVHEDSEMPVFKCSCCQYEGESKWYLGQHMKNILGSGPLRVKNVSSELAQKPTWISTSG